MKIITERSYWIDNLKSFITILIVAHHAALAYTTFSYFDRSTYINSTHPVVDNVRCIGLDVFANFNDAFFMPLMFLISGLFFFEVSKIKEHLNSWLTAPND
jgi:glucan biosynthesis protein C